MPALSSPVDDTLCPTTPHLQLDATMRLLAYWRGPAAVVLNAEWAPESVPMEQVAAAAGG